MGGAPARIMGDVRAAVCGKCAEFCFCQWLGKCGLNFVGENRKVIVMGLGTFLALCSLTFGIVGSTGLSADSDVVKSTNWVHLDVDANWSVHLNLGAVRNEYNGDVETKKWDDIDTDAFCARMQNSSYAANNNFDECRLQDCKDAATSLQISQVVATITPLLAINLALTRGSVNKDNGCYKLLTMINQLIGVVSALHNLAGFNQNCKKTFDDVTDEATFGPGFICPLCAIICQFLLWIIFCLCPAPVCPDGAHASPKHTGSDAAAVQVPQMQSPKAEPESPKTEPEPANAVSSV